MKAKDLLILVRQRLGDMNKVVFSDAELMYCLNNAMDELCGELADNYSPELLKDLALAENTDTFPLPDDFISWQGQYPINYAVDKNNQTQCTVEGPAWSGSPVTLKYFASRPHLTSGEDEIPFRTLTQQQNLLKKTLLQVKGGNTDDSQGTAKSNSSTGKA